MHFAVGIARSLQQAGYHLKDTTSENMELCYLRDKYKREVDFVVLRDARPLFAVECESGESEPSKHIRYFAEWTEIPVFYQVHLGAEDYEEQVSRVRFCRFEPSQPRL